MSLDSEEAGPGAREKDSKRSNAAFTRGPGRPLRTEATGGNTSNEIGNQSIGSTWPQGQDCQTPPGFEHPQCQKGVSSHRGSVASMTGLVSWPCRNDPARPATPASHLHLLAVQWAPVSPSLSGSSLSTRRHALSAFPHAMTTCSTVRVQTYHSSGQGK